MASKSLIVPLPVAEAEIFSYLLENLSLAAENCQDLAWDPRRGHKFYAFLKNIEAISLGAEQAAIYREDARWLTIAGQMGEVRKRCGSWLRGSHTKDERKEADMRFKKLSEVLQMLAREAEDMRNRATGRVGMILPKPLEGPDRDFRPVQILMPRSIH